MPFTEIGRITGSGTLTTGATGTFNLTLSTAPASGTWVVAAYYTNRGAVGVAGTINSVTCGTIGLTQIEPGSTNIPALWGSPWRSGMSTTLATNWTETAGGTTNLYCCSLVFSGATTTITGPSAFAFRQTTGQGSFDGAGGNTYGNVGTTDSAGVITWTNSSGNIPTSYDTQQEPFIAAFYNNAATTNLTTPKQLNATFSASVTAGGFLTTAFQTPGVVLTTSTTNVAASGKGVIYAPSGNFVFNYIAAPLAGVLSGCTTSAPVGTTIPTSAQLMLPINFSANILEITPSTSSATGTLGGFQTGNVSYTGTSTANGYVQIGIAGGTTLGRLTLIGGSATNGAAKTAAYGQLRIGGTGVSIGGGFIYTFVPSVRTLTRASRVISSLTDSLSRKKLWNRVTSVVTSLTSSTRKYANKFRDFSAVQSRSAIISKIVLKPRRSTLVQSSFGSVSRLTNSMRTVRTLLSQSSSSTRLVQRFKNIVTISSSLISVRKRSLFDRRVTTTQTVTATVVRRKSSLRGISVVSSYTIGTSRRSTFIRRVVANSSAAVQVSRSLGKNYLVTVSTTIRQATSGSVRLLIPVTALWNSTKNTATRLTIGARGLVDQSIFINSDDWQQPNNGQPLEGNETEIFDDVPETINETEDGLGTDIVPFHD